VAAAVGTWRALVVRRPSQSHKTPLTAVSFAPDGRLLMSFSMGDGNIRLWQISSTFIASMLGNATKCLKTMPVALSPASCT